MVDESGTLCACCGCLGLLVVEGKVTSKVFLSMQDKIEKMCQIQKDVPKFKVYNDISGLNRLVFFDRDVHHCIEVILSL